MLFIERTLQQGYQYECEDVFGKLIINANRKMEPHELDGTVLLALKDKSGSAMVESTLTGADGEQIGTFTLEKRPIWEDDEPANEEESCTDTPMSTSEPEDESTPTDPSPADT